MNLLREHSWCTAMCEHVDACAFAEKSKEHFGHVKGTVNRCSCLACFVSGFVHAVLLPTPRLLPPPLPRLFQTPTSDCTLLARTSLTRKRWSGARRLWHFFANVTWPIVSQQKRLICCSQKMERVKVDSTLVKVDSSLKDMGVEGMVTFKRPDAEDYVVGSVPLGRLPILVWNSDQEAAGCSAVWALLFHFYCQVWPRWDPLHRIHNDIWNSVSDDKFKPFVLLATILLNLSAGPWNGAALFKASRAEATTLFKLVDKRCVLSNGFIPR